MRTLLAALLLLLIPTASYATDPKPPESSAKYLKEMAWMIGTWEGKGSYHGRSFTDVTEFSWMFNKNFIKMKYTSRMGGKVIWVDSTLIGWDRVKKCLVSFTFGMDGTIGGGEYQAQKKKNVWISRGQITSSDPSFRNFRSVITRVDKDTYTTEIQLPKEGKWVTFLESRSTRKKTKEARANDAGGAVPQPDKKPAR